MHTCVRRMTVSILLLFTTMSLFSQTLSPKDPLRIGVDCSRFRGPDDNTTQVEMYYSFPQRALTYQVDSTGFTGAVDLTLTVRSRDSLVHIDRWLVPYTVRDTANMVAGMNLVGIYSIGLTEGEYIFKVLARDRYNNARKDSVSLRVPIRVVGSKTPTLSDVEFASSIRQGSKEGPFYKNTLDVVPNVGGMYAAEQKCYYYAEAYNLLAKDDHSDYTVRTTVYDAVGKEIISRERVRKRPAESTVIVDNFEVNKLRSGTYSLVLSLIDTSHVSLGTAGKKFFVYNPALGIDSSLLTGASNLPFTEYMGMEEPELDREFKYVKYEASEPEKGQYAQLKGVDVKRKFLSDFWRRRGPGRREEYMARVMFTNASYPVLGREGYRTDRGRVYIVYGPPDDYERHPNESETRPYEIWTYNNIQGGVIFVFVLRNQGGDYELVHSTHRNELHDENWDRVGITR